MFFALYVPFQAKMRHYLLANIQRRREYLKANPIAASPKLLTVLPDYVVVYVIHLMAHDPLYEEPADVEALNRIKECLWFQLEPHCSKNDNYSFSYFKKLLEGMFASSFHNILLHLLLNCCLIEG